MSVINQQGQEVQTQFNALQQVINFLLLVPAPSTVDDEFLIEVRQAASQYFQKQDRPNKSEDMVKQLFDALRQSLGPKTSAAYIKSMTVLGNVIYPIISQYKSSDIVIMPYATIIYYLLYYVTEQLAKHDCFILYGQDAEYTFHKTVSVPDTFPLGTAVDENGQSVPLYSPTATWNVQQVLEKRTCKFVKLVYLSQIIKSQQIIDLLGSDVQILVEWIPGTTSKYVIEQSVTNYILNKLSLPQSPVLITENCYYANLYYQVPGFIGKISFYDNYFMDFENQKTRIKISPEIFSGFFHGLCFDLLLYLNRIQKEKEIGQQTLNSISNLFKPET